MNREQSKSALSLEPIDRSSGQPSPEPSRLDRLLVMRMMRAAGDPQIRALLWNGEQAYGKGGSDVPILRFNSRAALQRIVKHKDIGFGDAYSDGDIEIDGNLEDFLREIYLSKEKAAKMPTRLGPLAGLFGPKARSNTLQGSKSNIHHHYDLGNDFYKLWLDEEMQYTCAYFPAQDLTIEQAQVAKMEHVCRKLQLKPGQKVVEAGCGWGSLAVYMARNHGVKVRSYNISHEQIVYAADRAKRDGLSDQIEYVEDDYRNINGEFDAFVSIGMLEHVGKTHYRQLGEVVQRCLTDHGRALVHSIGRNKPELMNAWIEKRIFPGAYPPTIREMMDIVEPYDFSVLDIENLRLHYMLTLRQWLSRFNRSESVVAGMFDERFVRAWRLYLAGSIAAFRSGSLQLFQMVFARGKDNTVPWTREHLYEP